MQLYVSVDVVIKESLKVVDRLFFGDFWERFLVSSFFIGCENYGFLSFEVYIDFDFIFNEFFFIYFIG